MDGWTIGADIGAMLTGAAVLPAATVWLTRQWRGWYGRRRHRLLPGEELLPGKALYSPDGRTKFGLGPDANMVVTVEGIGVLTDTGTVGDGKPKCLRLEPDGWLVLYDVDDHEIWKQGPGGARLEVQDNAHVVLYPETGKAIWATDWLMMRGRPTRHLGPGSELSAS